MDTKFFEKVYKTSEKGCWLWLGSKFSQGRYGHLKRKGRQWGAHRYSFFMHYRIDPADLYVCHHCDNGLCVNPSHLFLGTAKDNYLDMKNKNRCRNFSHEDIRGEKNPNAKLDEKTVKEIRKARWEGGMSYSMILQTFGLKSNGHLNKILKCTNWAHI